MWFDQAVVYQIYPLGLCDALYRERTTEETEDRHPLLQIVDWIPHIKKTGADCVLFNPMMESDFHGYDTRDYNLVDTRLGTNKDLEILCNAFHEAGIRILFDGVFHHVGRGFWAFKDVQEKKWDSPYCSWFHINFDGDTEYHDGFWYEGWEGHNELVKLNLDNPDVRKHQFEAIRHWTNLYGIDGLRLDVAYCLPDFYLKELRRYTDTLKPDFVLLGEVLHGDYNLYMNDGKCHSVTNYECYKGLYSSFNSANMHEISYSLNRQFGKENWCIYRGKHLLSFLDNHDVDRIATKLSKKEQLPALYGLLFGMPGVPAIYYGSEWGIEGKKQGRDEEIRPAIDRPEWNSLSEIISAYARVHREHPAMYRGGYETLLVRENQLVFERSCEEERVIVAINASGETFHADFNARSGRGTDLVTGKMVDFGGGSDLPPYSASFWKTEVI
ncbi:MAG: alpha-amylase family glycosyl hydrolase [Lachnospiraceae bacterium]|nr:alpha-amylase family glycosyl hydrolase [Lachnospiraceae bacterium]MDY5497767.1 alpha-amylase family glycosyl hydrolase [Anaerobutyricum sp.]